MKNKLISTIVLLFSLNNAIAQQFIKPEINSKTSFVIVVDEATFKGAENEIIAYKKSVEKDGLSTYVVYHDFKNPQQVKDVLLELYNQKNQKLEGAVFIGDIPIPMVRGAQNLTSTFKMNEKLKWERSSVPSDRFYDDFDLQFDYIKQDEDPKRDLLHYYNLNAASPQYIQMDIYSARIKPPLTADGENATEKIKQYLQKLVLVRDENNPLNTMIFSTGHGYSSDSSISWASDLIGLRSSFPNLFLNGNSIKFLNYRNATFLKNNLLTELMRDDLDLAFMTGHGTADLQMLNGYPDTSSPQESMENVGRYIRSKMRNAKDKNRNLDEVKKGFQDNLGLNDKLFKDAFEVESIEKDSIFNDNLDIQIRDLKNINARVAYLNSCLTGSYQLDDYLAGHYPFSNGKNIVTFANSVGVLQDLWATQMLGILQDGARVGNLLKKTAYLETHIMGDPTFHFTNDKAFDLNELMSNASTSKQDWNALLEENNADLQAYALTELFKISDEKKFSKKLVDIFKNSPYESVRTQAYFLLRSYNNKDFQEVLLLALNDNQEYIRRKALYDINDIGSDRFIPIIVDLYFEDQQLARSQYKINWALQFFNHDLLIETIANKDVSNFYNGEELKSNLLKKVTNEKVRFNKKREELNNKNLTEKELINEINSFRLYRYDALVPDLMNILIDTSNSENVRLTTAEVLSWFGMSYQYPFIEKELANQLKVEQSEVVKNQIMKTLQILKDASKRPF